DEGDELEVEFDKGIVKNKTKNIEIRFNPLPKVMLNILEDGGIVEHLKRHGDFKLEE
ncbi:MAG: 3-isopropylmalate dehydratase, partial [Candidatus Hydrothermarchaeota archaeon]